MIFFYGTLRAVSLLETVLGKSRTELELMPATLPDHAVFWVRDEPFPMIAARPGGTAEGIVLANPTAEDIARLQYYEGGFDYDLTALIARDAAGAKLEVQVFFPRAGQWEEGAPWSLDVWEREWGVLSLNAAREAMAGYGRWSAEELARLMPMMRRRAAAVATAGKRPQSPDHPFGPDTVEVLSRAPSHTGFFALDEMELRHPRFDGTGTETIQREVYFAGDAAVVLPYDPVRDEVLVIQQFRANVFAVGDPSPWVVECVAGLVDPGEDPDETARREALEEAGVHVRELETIARNYCSPGSSSQFLHIYAGIADFGALETGGGMADEGEDIRRILMPFDEFEAGLRSHRFRDMPLVTAGLWLALNRARLRASA